MKLHAIVPASIAFCSFWSLIDLLCRPDRSMELSLYQETPHPQMQDVTAKEPSADPGTLV